MPRQATPSRELQPAPLEVTKKETKLRKGEAASRNYVADCYSNFLEMYTAWNMPLPILGGRKPLEFWNDSVLDYAVLAAEEDDPNDPVEAYQSTVSRDKTNTLYANLSSKFFYPSCVAQNNEQSIDRTLGKIGDACLYWAYKQDGWPSESGQQKNARLVHKACVEGTAYTLDRVTEDGMDSEMMPNEEVFYPNLWQPNIQLQKRVYRAKLNMTVGEAEEAFGDYDAWNLVDTSGGWTTAFQIQYPDLKGIFDGIVQSDKVSVLYVWERATQKELKVLKAQNKVNKNAKRAWFYNIIVNNVPMFPVDNVCPYKSGILPISKLIFEPMAKAEFALGNSVPNKCMEDKKWKDAWKTNLRWRGKLAGMPPQLVIGGHLNGSEVMLPSQYTSLAKDVDVRPVPGIQPITSADIQLMSMADEEINHSTIEPAPTGRMAARTAMIQQANAQLMLEPFSQQLAFFAASRSFHILTAGFQYWPKNKLKMLAVPDQVLDDGLTGTFEVIFKEPSTVLDTEVDPVELQTQMDKAKSAGYQVKKDDMARLMHSFALHKKGQASRKNGHAVETHFVSPSYAQDVKWYLFADAADGMQDKDAMAQEKFSKDLPLFLSMPQYIVPQEVLREYVRMRGYNERLLQKDLPQGQPNQPGQPMPPQPAMAGAGNGTAPAPGAFGAPPSTPNQITSAAAGATGVPSPGRLAGV